MTEVISTLKEPGSSIQCGLDAEEKRQLFLARFKEHPPNGVTAMELDRHFAGMPAHYWLWTNQSDVAWGLEIIHKYLRKSASAAVPSAASVIDWRQDDEGRTTAVMVCARNRPGLLAKIAAVFRTVGLSILHADICTRADRIAVDSFRVCDLGNKPVRNAERLEQLVFLLEGALSDPPRFVSYWACRGHRLVEHPQPLEVNVSLDNESSPEHTILRVEASDRLGLLSDILETVADCGLAVSQALVTTQNGAARNQFFLNEACGGKVAGSDRLLKIERLVHAAVKMEEG